VIDVVVRDDGIRMFTVCNDFGDILIVTSDRKLAFFVEANSYGTDEALRLRIGGDPPTKRIDIFTKHKV
jgi:hypothetical protein